MYSSYEIRIQFKVIQLCILCISFGMHTTNNFKKLHSHSKYSKTQTFLESKSYDLHTNQGVMSVPYF